MKIKKYEEGTEGVSSTSSKPKKMNFVKKFINKQREKEQAAADYLESEDKKEAGLIEAKTPAENTIVSPQQPKAESTYTIDHKPEVKKLVAPMTAEMKKVAEWQRKRGLKADGIWGKDTQAAYEKEQAAKTKKMNLPKSTKSVETDMSKVKADKYVKAKITEAKPVPGKSENKKQVTSYKELPKVSLPTVKKDSTAPKIVYKKK